MAARYPAALQPVDPIEDDINHFFDQVVARMVAQRRLTLIAEAKKKRLEMTAQVTLRNQKEQELLDTKVEVERKMKTNELRELQERILVEIEAKLAEVRLPQPETRLVFQGECEQLDQMILGLGEVLEEAVPVIPRYQQMERIVAVGTYGQNPGELSNPNGVAIDENSKHIYVAEYDPARVSVFSDSGEFLNSFTREHMKHPWGIAIHRDNVYVTDNGVHGVFHFKIEPDMRLDAALKGKGYADGEFNLPRQLAVSANGDVFIADQFNHRIQILKFQRSITHESMHRPIDVKLTNTEVYVLSEYESPCVHVFSHAGEKIRSFITQGGGMQVTQTWFFCLDAPKNLIISDCRADSVKVFSPDGTLLHMMTGVINPRGVSVTKQLKFIVIPRGDNLKLQIYSIYSQL